MARGAVCIVNPPGVLYPALHTSGLLPADDEDNEDSDDDAGVNGGVAATSVPA